MHKKQHRPDWENTCNYCLYLQYAPRSARSGNCTLHRQWIQRSSFTTCSDMSVQPLDEGIYTLTAAAYGGWVHQRRHKRVRTRLFLLEGGAAARRTEDRKKDDVTGRASFRDKYKS